PCSAGALGLGLDVRGDGGYVVAPPTLLDRGRAYTWEIGYGPHEVPLAPMPAWLLKLLVQQARHDRLRCDGTPLIILPGTRHRRLVQLGGLLRRYGLGEAAIRG